MGDEIPLPAEPVTEDWLRVLIPPRRGGAAVAWELTQRIRHNQLSTGARLRQVEIMDEWDLTPAQARTALALLGRLGVVRQEPEGGAVVYRPTRRQVEESWRVRGALEGLAAEVAAPRIEQRQLDHLDAALEAMRAMRPPHHLRYLLVADPAFHDRIIAASGMPRLQTLVKRAQVAADIGTVLLTNDRFELAEAAWESHANIIRALAAHDSEAAGRAVRSHYDNRCAVWLRAWDAEERAAAKRDPGRRPAAGEGPRTAAGEGG